MVGGAQFITTRYLGRMLDKIEINTIINNKDKCTECELIKDKGGNKNAPKSN